MTTPTNKAQCVLPALKSVIIVLHYDERVQAEVPRTLYKRCIQWRLLLFLFI